MAIFHILVTSGYHMTFEHKLQELEIAVKFLEYIQLNL